MEDSLYWGFVTGMTEKKQRVIVKTHTMLTLELWGYSYGQFCFYW